MSKIKEVQLDGVKEFGVMEVSDSSELGDNAGTYGPMAGWLTGPHCSKLIDPIC